MFADVDHRLLVDWEDLARASLAMFRADRARYAGDPDFERLVARPVTGHKRLSHPIAGRMLFE